MHWFSVLKRSRPAAVAARKIRAVARKILNEKTEELFSDRDIVLPEEVNNLVQEQIYELKVLHDSDELTQEMPRHRIGHISNRDRGAYEKIVSFKLKQMGFVYKGKKAGGPIYTKEGDDV